MGGTAARGVRRLRAIAQEERHFSPPTRWRHTWARDPHPLSPEEAEPLLAEATLARDPSGETLILLGSPEVVERARAWVVGVMEMEQFLRDGTRDHRHGRPCWSDSAPDARVMTPAVRDDLALPPGHSARWPLSPVRPT